MPSINDEREMMLRLRRHLAPRTAEMVQLLGKFVRCESPSHRQSRSGSHGRAGRQRMATARRDVCAFCGRNRAGNHVRAEIWLGKPGGRTGRCWRSGHLDTVYPLGDAGHAMPFRVSGGRAFGPGTFDMKAGLVLALESRSTR